MITKILKLRELRTGAIITAAILGFGLVASPSVIANGVVHRVHVGGPDLCGNNSGCDKNFSLSAVEFADGTVKGQFTDRFGGGGGQGFHATLDCLVVIDSPFPFLGGKMAWVSGTITEGMFLGQDLAGQPVWAAAIDWGTSAKDNPDLITFAFIGDARLCNTFPDPEGIGGFLDRGQVTIK